MKYQPLQLSQLHPYILRIVSPVIKERNRIIPSIHKHLSSSSIRPRHSLARRIRKEDFSTPTTIQGYSRLLGSIRGIVTQHNIIQSLLRTVERECDAVCADIESLNVSSTRIPRNRTRSRNTVEDTIFSFCYPPIGNINYNDRLHGSWDDGDGIDEVIAPVIGEDYCVSVGSQQV
jgi:hypothetical protein